MRPHTKSGTEGRRLCHPWQRFGYFCKKKKGGKGRIKAEGGKGEGDPHWLVHSSNACIGHDWSRLEQAEKMGLESKHSI